MNPWPPTPARKQGVWTTGLQLHCCKNVSKQRKSLKGASSKHLILHQKGLFLVPNRQDATDRPEIHKKTSFIKLKPLWKEQDKMFRNMAKLFCHEKRHLLHFVSFSCYRQKSNRLYWTLKFNVSIPTYYMLSQACYTFLLLLTT